MRAIWWLLLAVAGGLVLLGGAGTDRKGFVERIRAAVLALGFSAATADLVAAHAAYESGWGRGQASRGGFNHFNLTRTPQDTRPIIIGDDTEYDAAGNVRAIKQRFRKYVSELEAVADYFEFLAMPRYRTARAQLVAGDAGFAATLGTSGYYTLPVPQYVQQFNAVLAQVRALRGTA
jgi:flagellar protein FlgJ